jgi:hypothetical protein
MFTPDTISYPMRFVGVIDKVTADLAAPIVHVRTNLGTMFDLQATPGQAARARFFMSLNEVWVEAIVVVGEKSGRLLSLRSSCFDAEKPSGVTARIM